MNDFQLICAVLAPRIIGRLNGKIPLQAATDLRFAWTITYYFTILGGIFAKRARKILIFQYISHV
ncbi:MAG: hypothetical protein ACJAXK_001297 [Yoonia sp.]